ncbi:MAG: serine/threonine-protein kinase [Myxococcota bacterium]|nr:serine/threonine-protein kinase [Myxococcota bacterium]
MLNPDDPWLGQTLDGRYRLLRRLGAGGMGVVYEAAHLALGEVELGDRLAVKVLRSTALSVPGALERLEREAQAASAIGDPHIVDVRDFGHLHGGQAYVVMELLEGRALWDELREGAFPWARAARLARHVAHGLASAHDAGIVHRDLKPENVVLVERKGERDYPKILDFGIAKLRGAGAKLTRAGEVIGTPQYMSPEQCLGLAVDPRADVYALGVLLYEMLTGEVPFDGDDLRAICLSHIQGEVPPLSAHGVEVPPALDAIVRCCLEKDADARFGSMREVAAALGEVLGEADEPSGPRPAVRLSSFPAPAQPAPLARRPRALPFALLGAGAALACAAVVAALVVISSPGESAAAQPSVPQPAVVRAPAVSESEPSPEPRPEPPAREEEETIALIAQPPAIVEHDGAPIGRTPLEVPRPADGVQAYTIRQPGYRSRDIALSARSRDEVVVRLERAPAPRRVEPAAPVEPEPVAPAAPRAAPTAQRAESGPFMNPWD